MKEIDVYRQYFAANCVFNGVERRAALVALTAASEAGSIRYEVGVSFFPHTDAEDFAVSYDAFASQELYAAPGRRSKKRETALMKTLRAHADAAAATLDGTVFWDQPLREAQYDGIAPVEI